MGGSFPITDEMHARNHPARIPTCSHWVTDTPTNLHPNTRGNHFEIQFEWHINNSLLDHPWSKNYHHKNAKFGLCLVYAILFQVNTVASSMSFGFLGYRQQCFITGLANIYVLHVTCNLYFCILWFLNVRCWKINLLLLLLQYWAFPGYNAGCPICIFMIDQIVR